MIKLYPRVAERYSEISEEYSEIIGRYSEIAEEFLKMAGRYVGVPEMKGEIVERKPEVTYVSR